MVRDIAVWNEVPNEYNSHTIIDLDLEKRLLSKLAAPSVFAQRTTEQAPSRSMKRYLLLAMAALYVSGCSAPSYRGAIEHSQQRGSIERVEHQRGYSRLSLAAMLWWAKLPEPIKVSKGTELYRVTYWT